MINASLASIKSGVLRTKVTVVGAGPVGLLTSKLLSSYNIPHILVERRNDHRDHPQAHYLTARTMEILRSTCWNDFKEIIKLSPPSTVWRDFSYCSSILGTEYGRQDHFKTTPSIFWQQTPATVLHLAQSKFESVLWNSNSMMQISSSSSSPSSSSSSSLEEEIKNYCLPLLGYRATISRNNSSGCTLSLLANNPSETEKKPLRIESDYIIAADGASSSIRKQLNITLQGKENLQHLINIHFKCPNLHQYLEKRSSMLYFVYHPLSLAVLVSHDPIQNEWVCQLPYFPPYQSLSDYTEEVIQNLLKSIILDEKVKLDIEIKHVNQWVMNAQVASHFHDPISSRIFLVGDAAHRFPPAGGFGMNSGLQDTHNLVWKLAMVLKQEEKEKKLETDENIENEKKQKIFQNNLLSSYEKERQSVAIKNTKFSIRNFNNSTSVPKLFGLDPYYAELAVKSADLPKFLPFFLRKQAFLTAISTGLSSLHLLKNNIYQDLKKKQLKSLIDQYKTLQLIFPYEDLGRNYPNLNSKENINDFIKTEEVIEPQDWNDYKYEKNYRIHHHWLLLKNLNNKIVNEKNGNLILSTLDLPHFIHEIIKNERKKIIDENNVNNSISPPPILLLLSLKNKVLLETLTSLLSNSLSSSSNSLPLAIIQLNSLNEENDKQIIQNLLKNEKKNDKINEIFSHKNLQNYLQLPFFNLKPDEEFKNNTLDELKDIKSTEIINLYNNNSFNYDYFFSNKFDKNSLQYIQNPSSDSLSSIPIINLVDILGNSLKLKEGDNEDRIVLLRPDGFILDVIDYSKEENINQISEKIISSLNNSLYT